VERLVTGKTPAETVNLVPRICAICSISHRYASIRAFEKALQVPTRKRQAIAGANASWRNDRKSCSPCFFTGTAGYYRVSSAIAMIPRYKFEVQIGLELKQFGNQIMELISGRPIHGENPVIGGFGKYPSKNNYGYQQ